jgi:predicted RNA-binding protein with PIN domain
MFLPPTSKRTATLLFLALIVLVDDDILRIEGLSWQSTAQRQFSSSSSFTRETASMSLLTLDHKTETPQHLYSRARRRTSFLVMGKGDGKKKRKKKSSAPSSSSTSSASAQKPPPQRVSTDINVPVRLQIKYGQMRKEAAKQTGASFRQKKVQRTKYRRSWDEEEIELKREERKLRGQDPDWDVILNRTAVSPLVIVDGYNIIHKWSRLKKHMNKGDAQRARQLLVDDLENLRSLKGWRIEVVFDGTGRSTVGPLGHGPGGSRVRVTSEDQAEKKSVTKYGVRTVFTGVGVEADSYIQARCAAARNVTGGETTGSFIVATDDSMIRVAGQSAGAFCMGAERFVDELKAMKKAMDYRVEAAVAKVNGHAIRPAQLRGTYTHGFGRNQILIEDKRKRKRKKEEEKDSSGEDDDLKIEIDVDEDGVPWWAKIPDQTRFDVK